MYRVNVLLVHRRGFTTSPVACLELGKLLDLKWLEKWKSLSPGRDSINPLHNDSLESEQKYILSMFPYPSGLLHMGHVRVYTISDVISRFHKMKGYNVIHPMGWDAFGLPAENAAIERNIDPAVWTTSNIAKMKDQMRLMLADFDWDRELATCDPNYYKHTQKLFTLLYEQGLAYKAKSEINWDPIDQTVLANEQVDDEGRSWRSGALVEKRLLEQWFLKITDFAHDLNQDLNILDQWPDKVKLMQRNWIGESKGVELVFQLTDSDKFVKTFTTRPDTIKGVQYVALALDHDLVLELAKTNEELQNFIKRAEKLPEDSKEGFELPISVTNPLKNDSVPVFVAPYVLGSYGHGAVMGVPGHDQRDFDFWLANKPESPIIKLIDGPDLDKPYLGKKGLLNANAEEFAGLSVKDATFKIIQKLLETNLGNPTTQYRIRDWLISRQRYWGAPIPIIYCPDCGQVPVPDKDLPVQLPKLDKIAGKGGSPLLQIDEFVNCKCPNCHAEAKRETDTMDTFIDSSWYFLRYLDPHNDLKPFNKDIKVPLDMYIGGVEHAILHLLYSRFITKFLTQQGLLQDSGFKGEPFKQLVTQGMVHGKTFTDPRNGRFLKPDELTPVENVKDIPLIKATGETPLVTYEKMSKSKYNGVDPQYCIEKYGADSTRAHVLFQAPINDVLDWDELKIVGVQRWLNKVHGLSGSIASLISNTKPVKPESYSEGDVALHNTLQQYIASLEDSFGKSLSLNTVISDYMKLTNSIVSALQDQTLDLYIINDAFLKLLTMMCPVTPTTLEESYENYCQMLGLPWTSVLTQPWPQLEPLFESDVMDYNVMINGKFKFVFNGGKKLFEDDELFTGAILSTPEGEKLLQGKNIVKKIFKPKMASFVVK